MLIINGKEAFLSEKAYTNFHGSSVFTTLLAKEKPFLWNDHWERLTDHAKYFDFLIPTKKIILEHIENFLSTTKIAQKVRIILNHDSYALTFENFSHPGESIYDGSNIKIIFSNIFVHDHLAIYKTGNYLPYVLAYKEAQKQNVYEALLCNHQGYVVDCTKNGFFIFQDNKIISPLGGLKSIMKKKALNFAKKFIEVQEKFIKPNEIKGQIFLTNSLTGVIPVGKIRAENELCKSIVDHCKTL